MVIGRACLDTRSDPVPRAFSPKHSTILHPAAGCFNWRKEAARRRAGRPSPGTPGIAAAIGLSARVAAEAGALARISANRRILVCMRRLSDQRKRDTASRAATRLGRRPPRTCSASRLIAIMPPMHRSSTDRVPAARRCGQIAIVGRTVRPPCSGGLWLQCQACRLTPEGVAGDLARWRQAETICG